MMTTTRPRLLDLFCCAGGAGVGYSRAGFEVVGVDISPQPHFPFEMIQADALKLDMKFFRSNEWPRLIEPVREMLIKTGKPYIIENVSGAPMINPVVLCGTMFKSLRVLRHRLFEANFTIVPPPHGKHPICHTFDKRKPHYGKTDDMVDFVSVNGGGNCTIAAARDAMGIDWMTKNELNESIPPAYTELIGRQLIQHNMQRETVVVDAPCNFSCETEIIGFTRIMGSIHQVILCNKVSDLAAWRPRDIIIRECKETCKTNCKREE